MRKTDSSGNTLWMTSSSSVADARSRPNGFSTTMRPPLWRSTFAMPCTTSSKSDGGIAR